MSMLVLRASVRHTLRHPGLVLLSVVGIALGVGVTLGVDLANESARRAFALSMERVTGKATHHIAGGPLGVPEGLYRELRIRHGLRNSAPLVEGHLVVRGESLQVLGVDPFSEAGFRTLTGAPGRSAVTRLVSEPGSVLLAQPTAQRLGLDVGDAIEFPVNGRHERLVLADFIIGETEAALDGLLVTDIATAQVWLGTPGYLSRIDLALTPQEVAYVRSILPASVDLQRSSGRPRAMEEMTRAFRLNLTALSLLALLVGMFLIYNTMSFAVLQRRTLLGELRVIGVTRSMLFAVTLGEALVLGTVGTLLGFGLGIVLGSGLVGLVTRTINDLYFTLTITDFYIAPWSFAKALVLGLGGSVLAAAVPAMEASLSMPRTVQARSSIEGKARWLTPRLAALAVPCLALAWMLLHLSAREILPGFVALFLLVAAAVLLTPLAVRIAATLGRRLSGNGAGAISTLAMRGVTASQSRTGVATAALMVAVAAAVGVGVMVSSFRTTVAGWLESTLQADIYVSVPAASSGQYLDADVVGMLSRLPGVRELSTGRFVNLRSADGLTRVNVLDPARASRRGFLFKSSSGDTLWEDFAAGNAVLISEPLAYRRQLAVGDSVQLRTARGERKFAVGGIYRDYGSDRGRMVMHRDLYARYWDDPRVSAAGLYLEPDADPSQVLQQVRQLKVGAVPLDVEHSAEIRRESLEIFDRTFTITQVLRVQVLFVAFVGILSALTALQLERRKELGVLRAVGFTPAELHRLVTAQTGFIGLVAGVTAIPLGLGIALILIDVINRRSFGWSMDTHFPLLDLVLALVLAVAAAIVAGLYPAYEMARTSPAEALREE